MRNLERGELRGSGCIRIFCNLCVRALCDRSFNCYPIKVQEPAKDSLIHVLLVKPARIGIYHRARREAGLGSGPVFVCDLTCRAISPAVTARPEHNYLRMIVRLRGYMSVSTGFRSVIGSGEKHDIKYPGQRVGFCMGFDLSSDFFLGSCPTGA